MWLVYGFWGHAEKEQLKCIPHTWRCLDNRKCIPYSSRCNGKFDCQDHSDEQYCAGPSENLEGKNNFDVLCYYYYFLYLSIKKILFSLDLYTR